MNKPSRMLLSRANTIALLLLLVFASRPTLGATREFTAKFDPAKTHVGWTLDATMHTVHGTFALKNGSLLLDPETGKASGEIVVDAKSGASGNDSRDAKMHKDVLQSATFSDFVFRPDKMEGSLAPSGTSTIQLHGKLSVHGAEHEITIPVTVTLDGQAWKASAKFTIPYVTWGMKNPSNFLLHVKPEVEVIIDGEGALQTAPLP